MKYKHIYTETKYVCPNNARCVDAYCPDYLAKGIIPEGAPALIRLCQKINGKPENITWQMIEATSEAQVIRQAILLFDHS